MKRILFIVCAVILFVNAEAQDKRKIAVLPAYNIKGSSKQYTELVTSFIDKAVDKDKTVKSYGAKKVASLMDKHHISLSQLSDDNIVKNIGTLSKTDYVLGADIASEKNGKVFITLKLMDVKTGEYTATDYTEITKELHTEPICYNAVNKLLHPGAEPVKNIGLPQPDKTIAVSNGLAGYWTFDDKQVIDITEYNNETYHYSVHKKIFNEKTVNGYGWALINSKLYIPKLFNTENWTLCLWMNIAPGLSYVLLEEEEYNRKEDKTYCGYRMKVKDGVLTIGRDGYTYKDDKNKIQWRYNESGQIDCYPRKMDWHHFVITKSVINGNEVFSLYVDGVHYGNCTLNGQKRTSAAKTVVGYSQWHSLCDNVRFYERILTNEEIKNIYDSERQ